MMWSSLVANTSSLYQYYYYYYYYPYGEYYYLLYNHDNDNDNKEGVGSEHHDSNNFKSYTEELLIGHWKTVVLLWCFYLLAGWLVYVRCVWDAPHVGGVGAAAWKRVLLVVAHPDDECMFFGPTIVNLIRGGAVVYVVCLSYGDYNRKGAVRKKELFRSCSALGIPQANVTVYRCTELPDDPDARWSTGLVGRLVTHHVHAYTIDTVLTFDRYGVSYHENHISAWSAVRVAASSSALPPSTRAYALETVNILRKYSVFFDCGLSSLVSPRRHLFVASPRDHSTIVKAMSGHQSQYVWFRRLFVRFSRYAYINTFKPI